MQRWVGVAMLAVACGGSEGSSCEQEACDTADSLKSQLLTEWEKDRAAIEAIGDSLQGAPCNLTTRDAELVDQNVSPGKSQAYSDGCARFEEARGACGSCWPGGDTVTSPSMP